MICGLAPNTAGIIAGVIIAVLLALIIIAIILFCCCRARNRKKYEKEISYEIRYGQRIITPSMLCRIPQIHFHCTDTGTYCIKLI